ncbi:MAG: hypothetical protein HQ464_13520 [Planctomycetes bacterium]|nr:hypothetical protein [Planctomycetota bacterium]
MTNTKTPLDPDAGQFQDFIRAGIGDLRRIVGGDSSEWGARSELPPVPQAAQLSMFLLLITKGVEPKHKDIFTHKNRLTEHLNKVYKKSKAGWEEALAAKSVRARDSQLHDTSVIEPYIAALVRFAEKNFGMTSIPLRSFGVRDVQVALAALIKKLATGVERDLGLISQGVSGKAVGKAGTVASEDRSDIPAPVLGGLLVATVAGDVGLQGSVTRDQAMAMRVGVGIGTSKAEPGKPEPKAAKKIRRTLEGLAEHVQALKD